jgi:dihydroneopterin aldolase
VNTTWSVRIERLRTQLRVGIYPDELEPQPVRVTLLLHGVSAACPTTLGECIDYEPLCRWVTEEWPSTAHIPLLETRVNELIAFAFDFDGRVQEVHAGLAKERVSGSAVSVGIERSVSRAAFEAQRRHVEMMAALCVPSERTRDEHLPA